jgi:DNA polymerase
MKTDPRNYPQEIVPALISYLKTLQRKGIKSLYLDEPAAAEATGEPTTHDEENAMTAIDAASSEERLAQIEAIVKVCTDCALHKGRTNGVFGVGNPRTDVMFIGEGPGRDEDLKGEPFVGRSGQLLTKIIEAIDFTRAEVYITNIVKCRPPDNRDPLEEEVRCCEKYLVDQIKLIQPKVICALGRVAAHWLLDTKASLSFLRENHNEYHGIPVLVTYHPAALLRNPQLKKSAWEDFKRLKSMISK